MCKYYLEFSNTPFTRKKIYLVVQKMVQLLVGQHFKTAWQNSTNFQKKPVICSQSHSESSKNELQYRNGSCLKLLLKKTNIVYTNIECVLHALCNAYCSDKVVPGLSIVPNCHHYQCGYNLGWCM